MKLLADIFADPLVIIENDATFADVSATNDGHAAGNERADLDEASRLCQAHRCGLRTPDALHAAIAMRLRLPLLTCDKGQAEGCGYHAIGHEYIGTP